MRRARRLVRPETRRGVLVRLGTASVDDGDGVEIEDPSRPLQILSVLDADISSLGDAEIGKIKGVAAGELGIERIEAIIRM